MFEINNFESTVDTHEGREGRVGTQRIWRELLVPLHKYTISIE
jgi:hypothetical protein